MGAGASALVTFIGGFDFVEGLHAVFELGFGFLEGAKGSREMLEFLRGR